MEIDRIIFRSVQKGKRSFFSFEIKFLYFGDDAWKFDQLCMPCSHGIQSCFGKVFEKHIFIYVQNPACGEAIDLCITLFVPIQDFFMAKVITKVQISNVILNCPRGSFDFPTFSVDGVFAILLHLYDGFLQRLPFSDNIKYLCRLTYIENVLALFNN